MPTYAQASFKNSRIASRKATLVGQTTTVTLAIGAYLMVAAANVDRTYITLANFTVADNLRYSYGNIGAAIDTQGFPLKPNMGADLEAPLEIWVKNYGPNIVDLNIDQGIG